MQEISSVLTLLGSSLLTLGILLVSLAPPFVREWLLKLVTGHAQSKFNERLEATKFEFAKQIETLKNELGAQAEQAKSELRKSEEEFRVQLQTNERQVKSLIDAAMSLRSSRTEALQVRRLKAAEQLWQAKAQVDKLRMAVQLMRTIDFDKASMEVRENTKVRELFKVLRDATAKPEILMGMMPIQSERPFLSARAWAAFSAYFAVLSFAYLQLNVLAIGTNNMTAELFDDEATKKLLKSTLPHMATLIDEQGAKIFPFLIDQLDENLLKATTDMVEGKEDDAGTVEQMLKIANLASDAVNAQKGPQIAVPPELLSAQPPLW